jgi:hypothetical protein
VVDRRAILACICPEEIITTCYNCWHRLDHVCVDVLSDDTGFIEMSVLRPPYIILTGHVV